MKTLVIGGSGYIGSRLVEDLRTKMSVVGTYNTRSAPSLIQLDLTAPEQTQAILRQESPDVIIHSGGFVRVDDCELNPQEAIRRNVNGIDALVSSGIKTVYFSTDMVFDGTKQATTPEDAPNPINWYGRAKQMAEQEILRNKKNGVVRFSFVYGISPNNMFYKNLQKPKICAFDDQLCNPLFLDDILANIDTITSLEGTYHLCGEEIVTKYAFFQRVVTGLDLSSHVEPIHLATAKSAAARPEKLCMQRSPQFTVRPLDEAIALMKTQIQNF